MSKIISCETISDFINSKISVLCILGRIGDSLQIHLEDILNYNQSVKDEEEGIFMVYEYIHTKLKESLAETSDYNSFMINKMLSKQLQQILDWMNE